MRRCPTIPAPEWLRPASRRDEPPNIPPHNLTELDHRVLSALIAGPRENRTDARLMHHFRPRLPDRLPKILRSPRAFRDT